MTREEAIQELLKVDPFDYQEQPEGEQERDVRKLVREIEQGALREVLKDLQIVDEYRAKWGPVALDAALQLFARLAR